MLLPIATVLTSLVQRADDSAVPFDTEDLSRVRELAEAAASAHDVIALVGIDIVLNTDASGSVTPVLLELNPRPAGLAHARFLPGAGEGRGEAGVSLTMWDGIARYREPTHSSPVGV
jgi:D-alanine-D-alanine ligase-like ATP-grasp enzyme|tara:strand:- start:248 stop:598 length:351 start_codon:yes stop_codon:yes gene_type:complete